MDKKVIFGIFISFGIVVTVLAMGLNYGLRDDNSPTLEIDTKQETSVKGIISTPNKHKKCILKISFRMLPKIRDPRNDQPR